jgi:hypothetical protein
VSFHVNAAGVLVGDATEWREWTGKGRQAITIGLWECADGWRHSQHLRFPNGGYSAAALMRDPAFPSKHDALRFAVIEARGMLNGSLSYESKDLGSAVAWLDGLITDPTQADLFAAGGGR